MKIAYFDCFSGISGDMCLGALVDAGLPLSRLKADLRKIPLDGYALSEKKVLRAGIAATKIDVELIKTGRRQESESRRWRDIQKIISKSSLPEKIKKQGQAVFKNLFEAEAKVHGKTINTTHLHELGSVDCLVDILGTLIGLSFFGIEKVYASKINTGSGTVRTAHGILPVPAPATAELLKGLPCYSSGPSLEMTTPTGAALLKTISSGFGGMPQFVAGNIGYGAGGSDIENHPNVLRVTIGEAEEKVADERIMVIETNIDDMNPQIYPYVTERLMEAGALDVTMTQMIMKKGRPGILLTLLCRPDDLQMLSELVFKETTAIGLRFYETGRIVMNRTSRMVSTKYGNMSVKEVSLRGIRRAAPEYEDCARIARKKGIPVSDVMKEALVRALDNRPFKKRQ